VLKRADERPLEGRVLPLTRRRHHRAQREEVSGRSCEDEQFYVENSWRHARYCGPVVLDVGDAAVSSHRQREDSADDGCDDGQGKARLAAIAGVRRYPPSRVQAGQASVEVSRPVCSSEPRNAARATTANTSRRRAARWRWRCFDGLVQAAGSGTREHDRGYRCHCRHYTGLQRSRR